MIKKDLSHLPRGSAAVGVKPDPDPFIGRAVAAAWLMDNHSDDKPHAVEGTKFRFSMAGMCGRSLAYYFSNESPTNLPDSADAWRMGLGTMVHEAVQSYFAEAVASWRPEVINDKFVADVNVEFEVPVHLPRISGSGSADMVIDYLDANGQRIWRQVVELKTINGFGFKMSATGFKGPAQGPRLSHVQQAALCSYGLGADEMIICYLSMENVSPSLAESYCDDPEFGRFTAQWTYGADEIKSVAVGEIDRLLSLFDEIDAVGSDKVERTIYSDSGDLVTISDPKTGSYVVTSDDGQIVDAGKSWVCGYCRFQDVCVASNGS